MKNDCFRDMKDLEEKIKQIETLGTFPFYDTKFPWLNAEKENFYIEKAKLGDENAKRILILTSLRRIISIARTL